MRAAFPVTAVATIALALSCAALPPPAGAAASAPKGKVIKVCVKKKTGVMRLVKSRKACKRGERFLKWPKTVRSGGPNTITINVVCNLAAEAARTGASSRPRRVQRIRIPTSNGGTIALAITCANTANS